MMKYPPDVPISKEKRTVELMIELYCRRKHRPNPRHDGGHLCPECRDLRDYAHRRLELCPLKPRKPVCAVCSIHCYHKDMRRRIKEVMRFSGPRMAFRHPLIAVAYVWRKSLDPRRQ